MKTWNLMKKFHLTYPVRDTPRVLKLRCHLDRLILMNQVTHNLERKKKLAFKKLLDEGDSIMYEPANTSDQTLRYKARMDDLTREIERILQTMKSLSDPPSIERVNRNLLQDRLKDILRIELPEIIEKIQS